MGMHESGGIARLIHVLACAGMPAEISIYLSADHIRAEESCGGIKEMGRGGKKKDEEEEERCWLRRLVACGRFLLYTVRHDSEQLWGELP